MVGDFRSYATADLTLAPGVSMLLGRNGDGKTNVVEAAGYVATLASHRVAQDAPLVRLGASSAVIRAEVVRDDRPSVVELEILPGKANRARLNSSALPRARDVLGTLRTVLFAPEDLALVKGDPAERRRFLDDLLVARQPRWSGVRTDYDRVLRQRNALLRSAAALWRPPRRRAGAGRGLPTATAEFGTPSAGGGGRPGESLEEARDSALRTLSVFDDQLCRVGAALTYARLRLLRDLGPYLEEAYGVISDAETVATAHYRSSLREDVAARLAAGEVPDQEVLVTEMASTIEAVRRQEQERGVTLVGPHRDDLVLTLGELPAKGYASHGESWSFALALRLAAFRLLRTDLGTDPVLILDDVFAELDQGRRRRLAELVADCEQVLITAAVPEDVPDALVTGAVFDVTPGTVSVRTGNQDRDQDQG